MSIHNLKTLKDASKKVNFTLMRAGRGYITVSPLQDTDLDTCGYCRFCNCKEDSRTCKDEHAKACKKAHDKVCESIGIMPDGNNITVTGQFKGIGTGRNAYTIPDPAPDRAADIPYMVNYIMENMNVYIVDTQARAMISALRKDPDLCREFREQYQKIMG